MAVEGYGGEAMGAGMGWGGGWVETDPIKLI